MELQNYISENSDYDKTLNQPCDVEEGGEETCKRYYVVIF